MDRKVACLLILLGLGGCGWVDSWFDSRVSYSGYVMETRGLCYTILSDRMRAPDDPEGVKTMRLRLAVRAHEGADLEPGRWTKFRARTADKQDCAGALVLTDVELDQ